MKQGRFPTLVTTLQFQKNLNENVKHENRSLRDVKKCIKSPNVSRLPFFYKIAPVNRVKGVKSI